MSAEIQPVISAINPSLRNKLVDLVGKDNLQSTSAAEKGADSTVWPKISASPGNERELAEVLRLSNESRIAVIPRGGGTKLRWGNPPSRADLILSTARLNKIIEHAWADLTLSVEAGCTIRTLQEALAQHGQRLAVDPLWPEAGTVGGVLSTNDSGVLRLRFGALRDLIIGVTLALPDGTLASSGGKVVKNVAGYDLPKLVTGAFGTLGVITRAVFRLHPLPRNARTFSISALPIENMQRLVLAIQDSKLAHASLQLRIAAASKPIVDILFEGTSEGLVAQEAHLRTLAGAAHVTEVSPEVWNARQELWNSGDPEPTAIAKISVLPADIAKAVAIVNKLNRERTQWKTVVQATGIGWLRLEGSLEAVHGILQGLRSAIEQNAGSLVVLRQPSNMPALDTWGATTDALPLMKAIKHQLDPRNTLNPGRFVGGI